MYGIRLILYATIVAALLPQRCAAQSTQPRPYGPPDFDETLIEGTVTDEETGQPVSKFTIIPGRGIAREHHLMHQDSQGGVDGQFEFAFDRRPEERLGLHQILIRIEADGYAPRIIELPPHEQVVKLDIKLRRAANLTGRVLTPDERPAAGAIVLLGTKSAPIHLENDQPPIDSRGPRATTDADGRFAFPPTDGTFRLVVIHETGYGDTVEGDFDTTTTITLQPWGRVEGIVIIGANPEPGAMVVIQAGQEPRTDGQPSVVRFSHTSADSGGRFVFTRVAPGKATIARRVEINADQDMPTISFTSVDPIDLPAGQVLQVQVGGRGRPVSGQVRLPDGAIDEWISYPAHLMPVSDKSNRYLPPRYAAELDPHGFFCFDDVEPGRYRLHIQFHQSDEQRRWLTPVAIATADVTIPEIPGRRSDESLDIGEVEVKPYKQGN